MHKPDFLENVHPRSECGSANKMQKCPVLTPLPQSPHPSTANSQHRFTTSSWNWCLECGQQDNQRYKAPWSKHFNEGVSLNVQPAEKSKNAPPTNTHTLNRNVLIPASSVLCRAKSLWKSKQVKIWTGSEQPLNLAWPVTIHNYDRNSLRKCTTQNHMHRSTGLQAHIYTYIISILRDDDSTTSFASDLIPSVTQCENGM